MVIFIVFVYVVVSLVGFMLIQAHELRKTRKQLNELLKDKNK